MVDDRMGYSMGKSSKNNGCFKISYLPSGKRLHNYGKSPFYSWVNQICLWSFSIAMLLITRGYYPLYPQTKSEKKKKTPIYIAILPQI